MSNINNRELSWLSFNERVLMEALDLSNPLMERLKFVAIFSSNLDEFFMVRVSGLREQLAAGYDKPDISGLKPEEQLEAINNTTGRLGALRQNIFRQLIGEMEGERIFFPSVDDEPFADILESIFLDEIMPVISPVTIDPSHPFPFVYSRRICIIVESRRDHKDFNTLIMIPETLRRVYRVARGRSINIFTVEDIICKYLPILLKGYRVLRVGIFRVTRDADLDVTAEESADLLKTIEHLLTQRKRGDVNRVEIASGMSPTAVEFLKKNIGFVDTDIDMVDGILDLTFLFSLYNLKDLLKFPPLKQRPLKRLEGRKNIFDVIKEKPIFFFRPYNSFSLVSNFIAQAAVDDNVLAIKLTLYRTNRDSSIIAALLEAAKRGKQVSVVVELKARFDEERNIEWAKNLEKAGCIVTYGIVGLKIHAKCMLIVRTEHDRIVRYTHVATGNYNENTADVYTDVDYITADENIGWDAAQLFNYLMGYTEEESWRVLKVAPFNLRDTVVSMIDKEIEFARAGEPAKIVIKVNSLIDQQIIEKLYEASAAGVKVNLIVRGICGLKPGVPGLSENISVRSIIGRFLEHLRVLYFRHGGVGRYFITSADMMPRNLNGRVELMVEITDDDFRRSLEHFISISLMDNTKAWEMHDDKYSKLIPLADQQPLNSQEFFLNNEI